MGICPSLRMSFVPYPRAFQTKTGFSPSGSKACARQISATVDRSSNSKREPSEGVRGNGHSVRRCVPRKFYSGSIWDIATRIGEARDKFQKASEEVQALKSSPKGFVLGSDLSKFSIGSTSLVQDLEVPAAPKYWGLAPEEVLTLLRTYISQQGIPERQCDEYVERLCDILAALRGWTHGFADQARPLLDSTDSREEDSAQPRRSVAIDALITLLQMSGFAVLPEIPDITEPPCPEALPLGNSIEETLDPTLLRDSPAIRKHIKSNGVHIGSPSYYPYLFIATRGISLVRKTGLLVPQKIRAIERSYFNWIRTPFALLVEPLRALSMLTWNQFAKSIRKGTNVRDESSTGDMASRPAVDAKGTRDDRRLKQGAVKQVRRVVPAVQLDGGLEALTGIFLPTFTQEPAHELMVLLYREVQLDKELIRKEARAALMQQVRTSIAQAINPIPPKRRALERTTSETEASVFDNFAKPRGSVKPVSLQMFADVQWGTMTHFFPSTFVLPATSDLLRIDALTFIGLVSTFFTYVRNSESVFIYALLAGSIISYSLRVAFGWRSSLTTYRGRIARDRAASLLSRQKSTLDSLAANAAEELFPDVCCVWLSSVIGNGLRAQVLQEEAFGEVSLTGDTVKTWNEWLESNINFRAT